VPTPDGRSAYITLRGGGLFILDLQAWTIVAKFTRSQVAANGCGGVPSRDGGKMYINSGSATSGSLYVFDLATHTMMNSMDLTPYGTDAHGAALTRMGRFLWVVNRLADNAVVVDTSTDTVVGTVEGIGDAPDLMVVSPFGERAFITLRGPNPATGTHAIAGMTPGVAVVNLEAGGRNGRLAAIIPIGSWSADSPNDPHGIALRIG
jgi:DNA-binding beta-propeller fold protein YncE